MTMVKKQTLHRDGAVTKLSEAINPDAYQSPFLRKEELYREAIIVLDATWQSSSRGEFVQIDIIRVRMKSLAVLQTGCWPIKAALTKLEELNALPIVCMIVPDGQSARFVDAKLPPGFDVEGLVNEVLGSQTPLNIPSE